LPEKRSRFSRSRSNTPRRMSPRHSRSPDKDSRVGTTFPLKRERSPGIPRDHKSDLKPRPREGKSRVRTLVKVDPVPDNVRSDDPRPFVSVPAKEYSTSVTKCDGGIDMHEPIPTGPRNTIPGVDNMWRDPLHVLPRESVVETSNSPAYPSEAAGGSSTDSRHMTITTPSATAHVPSSGGGHNHLSRRRQRQHNYAGYVTRRALKEKKRSQVNRSSPPAADAIFQAPLIHSPDFPHAVTVSDRPRNSHCRVTHDARDIAVHDIRLYRPLTGSPS
jgi:hypothetical protein